MANTNTPGYEAPNAPNVSDHYGNIHIQAVKDSIRKSQKPDGSQEFDASCVGDHELRTSVISMQDAIRLSKNNDYQKSDSLSAAQKQLVATVAEERKDKAGRDLTDEMAKREEYIAAANLDPKWGGHHDIIAGVTVLGKNVIVDPKVSEGPFHHEMTHGQQPDAMPKGLSSYDQALWHMGQEGQAFVAEADEKRRRENIERRREGKPELPPLTAEQKREIFVSQPYTDDYAERYHIKDANRSDGKHLTREQFNQAFGTVPGHEKDGNFLDGGHYKDVAELYTGKGTEKYPANARQALLDGQRVKSEDLPKPDAHTTRYINQKTHAIIDITPDEKTNLAHMTVYVPEQFPASHIQGYRPAISHDISADAYNKAVGQNADVVRADGHPKIETPVVSQSNFVEAAPPAASMGNYTSARGNHRRAMGAYTPPANTSDPAPGAQASPAAAQRVTIPMNKPFVEGTPTVNMAAVNAESKVAPVSRTMRMTP